MNLNPFARKQQAEAAEREHAHLAARVHELEACVDLPYSDVENADFPALRRRIHNLQAQAAENLRQHPDDDWSKPLRLSDYLR
jgi:hypothetical protein